MFFLRTLIIYSINGSLTGKEGLCIVPSNWILTNQWWYYFTTDGEINKDLRVDGFDRIIYTKTDDKGRIKNIFLMANSEIDRFRRTNEKIIYETSVLNKNLEANGEIYLCDNSGVTFTSDIDDTIKVTSVYSRHLTYWQIHFVENFKLCQAWHKSIANRKNDIMQHFPI